LKLLPEPEGEEPLEDDDPVPEGDVDPVLLALDAVGLETEPDLESSYEMQGQAIGNTHEDGADDEDPELVEVTVAPTVNGALEPTTELTLLH